MFTYKLSVKVSEVATGNAHYDKLKTQLPEADHL